MNRKLKKLSLVMILLGIMFIAIGCIGNIYQVNKYKEQTKQNTFTLHIQSHNKATVKVLGYKPDNNTKETILEAYGIVEVKQNSRGETEIIIDTESGE
nr:MAG TPA: hypothetical protein [Caudoviricetes sp.]